MVTIRDITFVVSDISDVSEILPFLVWLRRRSGGMAYRILGLFFLVSGCIKTGTFITAQLGIHNLPAYHLLALLEVVFVYCFYQRLHSKDFRISRIVILCTLYALNALLQNISTEFNSYTWTATVILVLFMGLNHLYLIYNSDSDNSRLETRPDFVITVAWLIYGAGSLFTYLMGTDILSGTPDGFFKNAWIIQCLSNILKNLLVSYGFWLTTRSCRN